MKENIKEANVRDVNVDNEVVEEIKISEEKNVDEELMEKKQRRKKRVGIIVSVVTVLVIVVLLVYNYSSPFDDTVTHFSDEGSRVGNNVYGYIDVPEGFVVTGSFDPKDENYAGGKDGIAEGVQLKSKDGTMYIMISLVTADRNRDDYVGFGDDRYCLYEKKNYFHDAFDVFTCMSEDLIQKNILEVGIGGLASQGTSGLEGGMWGAIIEWKGQISEKEYRYHTFILENPEHKGVFHYVTAAYTGKNEECVKYAETFSLLANQP